MNRNINLSVENLSDEQILKEFVKRFECDGAILLYMDKQVEHGFGRWTSGDGRLWVNNLFKIIQGTPTPKLKPRKKLIENSK